MSELKLRPCPRAFDDFYRSKFLTGDDLVNKRVTFTIEKFFQAALKPDEGEEAETVIVAKGKETRLLLKVNFTNAQCLKVMFGAEFQFSEGKRIVLTAEREQVGRDMLNVVRIVGSPDIEHDVVAEFKMPFRKKLVARKLFRTVTNGSQPRRQQQEPPAESRNSDDAEDFDR